MTSKTAGPYGLNPSDIARFQRSVFDRSRRLRRARLLVLMRVGRAVLGGLIAAIRLIRSAPPLGDVGTRGGDLTRWIQSQNANDSNRE